MAAPSDQPETPQDTRQSHFPIPLAIMQPGTVAPVNIYIRTGDAHNLYKTANTPLRDDIRERLLQRGVRQLYLRRQDKDAYFDYVERHITDIIRDELLPPQEAARVVYQSSSRVMVDVFADPRSGKNLRRAQGLVEATVMSIMKRPDSLWQMTSVASHDYYTYTHCVNVCMFLVGASRELLGVEGEPQLRRIGLGGIFHDVGKSQVPEHILNKPGKLTPEEFEEIKRHPALGVELIAEQRSLSVVASAIVRSHHERYEGGGYPDGVPAEGLRDVVRLSTIIDVYDALTTERCYARARSPFAALQLMLNDMDGHFDPDLLRRFVAFLGPSQAEGPPMEALRVASGDGE
ncbi:MAG: HD domain-containing protein [Candidatus Brocadiia bacterium]